MSQQLNDAAVSFYQFEIPSTLGDLNQLELEWLQLPAQGATSNDLNDAWAEFLDLAGFQSKSEWLDSLGHTGQLNDQQLAFYEA